jgi:hypothetical protein
MDELVAAVTAMVRTLGGFSDVYDPCTGEVQAKVPLASTEEGATNIRNPERALMAGETPV